ncbi:hypothetical protein TcCL_Unassigned02631 [Trypanosoma cruzi]|nr:hypothetical protein TcCL_Unassigned02631 [Trypanosoma cruzi]
MKALTHKDAPTKRFAGIRKKRGCQPCVHSLDGRFFRLQPLEGILGLPTPRLPPSAPKDPDHVPVHPPHRISVAQTKTPCGQIQRMWPGTLSPLAGPSNDVSFALVAGLSGGPAKTHAVATSRPAAGASAQHGDVGRRRPAPLCDAVVASVE